MHVDAHDPVEVRNSCFEERTQRRVDARVVHDNIDAPVLAHDGSHHFADLRRVRDVATGRQRAAARGADLADDGFRRPGIAAATVMTGRAVVIHDDAGAARREVARMRTADAAARARDQHDPVFELQHVGESPLARLWRRVSGECDRMPAVGHDRLPVDVTA